jgi:hypothetical protein
MRELLLWFLQARNQNPHLNLLLRSPAHLLPEDLLRDLLSLRSRKNPVWLEDAVVVAENLERRVAENLERERKPENPENPSVVVANVRIKRGNNLVI